MSVNRRAHFKSVQRRLDKIHSADLIDLELPDFDDGDRYHK